MAWITAYSALYQPTSLQSFIYLPNTQRRTSDTPSSLATFRLSYSTDLVLTMSKLRSEAFPEVLTTTFIYFYLISLVSVSTDINQSGQLSAKMTRSYITPVLSQQPKIEPLFSTSSAAQASSIPVFTSHLHIYSRVFQISGLPATLVCQNQFLAIFKDFSSPFQEQPQHFLQVCPTILLLLIIILSAQGRCTSQSNGNSEVI